MTLDDILELHRQGDLDAAESAYREYIAAHPDEAEPVHLLGVLRHRRGDANEALDLLRRAVALAPDTARHHLALGGALLDAGHDDVAHAAFARALELDPNMSEAHRVLGHLHLRAGEVDAAESRFKIGLRAQEDDPMVLLGLGNVYLARHDPVNAAKFLARAAEMRPGGGTIQASLGRALFEQGAFGLAERALENALNVRPKLSIARLYLARAQLRQDKLEAAREGFAQLLDDGQQQFGAYAGLGDVARKKDQPIRALKYYRHALALDPTHAGAANACAWCMEKLNDLPAAVDYLRQALRHDPQAYDVRRALGELLERLGRRDEAAQVRAEPTRPT